MRPVRFYLAHANSDSLWNPFPKAKSKGFVYCFQSFLMNVLIFHLLKEKYTPEGGKSAPFNEKSSNQTNA